MTYVIGGILAFLLFITIIKSILKTSSLAGGIGAGGVIIGGATYLLFDQEIGLLILKVALFIIALILAVHVFKSIQ